MNKYVFQIVVCCVGILLPIVFTLYFLWDIHQPKTGPVGDGKPNYPTFIQMVPAACCVLIGALNLPVAIMRYRQNKKAQTNDQRNEEPLD